MNIATRTLEERIKFDHGLTIGTHVVDFKLGERSRRAVVRITPRGLVRILAKPRPEDMYSCWDRVRGDVFIPDKGVIVWGARDPEILKMFDGEPAASIPVK